MVGSGEYSSGVCLQSGRRMSEGLLKDDFLYSSVVICCMLGRYRDMIWKTYWGKDDSMSFYILVVKNK